MISRQDNVSVIGLGNMGSALARAISATDHHLTVWNRSEAKSHAMRDEEGAEVAESVADAVSKSQVVVVCVRGYDAATSLFQNPEIEPLLAGKTVSTDPAASAVINTSGLAFLYVAAHAFVSAAALCDAADAPLDLLADAVGKFMPQLPLIFGEYASMISAGTYESTNLRLTSRTEALAAISEFGDSMGVDVKLFQSALSTFQDANKADAGVNLAAIFEVLKQR